MINRYPYTDLHELNLDFLLSKIKELSEKMDLFIPLNTIEFKGQWDITQAYSQWNVVTDNNLGYIALKPVPEGIQLNNTEYWALIFDYNSILNPFKTKNIICIGDSYANTGKWADTLVNIMGLDADQYHINYLGGTGFVADIGGGTNGFLRLLTESAQVIIKKEEITDIIVAGGYNDNIHFPDSSGVSAIRNQIAAFKTYANDTFPNAKIHVGFIAYNRYPIGGVPIDDLLFTQYAYKGACLDNNIDYLEGAQYALTFGVGNLMNGDGVHPNTTGGGFIAEYLLSSMQGHNPIINTPGTGDTITVSDPDGDYNDTTTTLYTTFSNNIVNFKCEGDNVTGSKVISQSYKRHLFGKASIPNRFYCNEDHVVWAEDLIVIDGSKRVVDFEIHLYQNELLIYGIVPGSGTISTYNIPKFEFNLDLYAK